MGKVIITSKNIFRSFIHKEIKNSSVRGWIFPQPTRSFIKSLRQYEFHFNSKGIWHRLLVVYYYKKYLSWSLKTGISIPKNVCDIGLSIPHYGSIVVNANSSIGKNCRIMNNVNIGASGGCNKAPQIGDNVYIGPGAVIFGDIQIADGGYIGANAVVNKSFLEPNSVIVGCPAKVIKKDPIHWWEKNKQSSN